MYAAVTRDEGNAADDVLVVDQGLITPIYFVCHLFYDVFEDALFKEGI
jgi:hypothetical protein